MVELCAFDLSSPRTWGCFYIVTVEKIAAEVFPTHVGVFLTGGSLKVSLQSLPHARGGVSVVKRRTRLRGGSSPRTWGVSVSIFTQAIGAQSSPRTWGCFQRGVKNRLGDRVFPTHVGVFPIVSRLSVTLTGLPHACGGVSYADDEGYFNAKSSPRMWGCFFVYPVHRKRRIVFPTHVGVFLTTPVNRHRRSGLPTYVGVFLLHKVMHL